MMLSEPPVNMNLQHCKWKYKVVYQSTMAGVLNQAYYYCCCATEISAATLCLELCCVAGAHCNSIC